jgi:hypothetical protein
LQQDRCFNGPHNRDGVIGPDADFRIVRATSITLAPAAQQTEQASSCPIGRRSIGQPTLSDRDDHRSAVSRDHNWRFFLKWPHTKVGYGTSACKLRPIGLVETFRNLDFLIVNVREHLIKILRVKPSPQLGKSSISRQLPAAPMRVLAIGIEYPLDAPIEGSHHRRTSERRDQDQCF